MENRPKTELANFVKLLLKSEFFKDLFFVLTGKNDERDLINLFLSSWNEEEVTRGKNFYDCYGLILPLIMAISELDFIEGECCSPFVTSENKDKTIFH